MCSIANRLQHSEANAKRDVEDDKENDDSNTPEKKVSGEKPSPEKRYDNPDVADELYKFGSCIKKDLQEEGRQDNLRLSLVLHKCGE